MSLYKRDFSTLVLLRTLIDELFNLEIFVDLGSIIRDVLELLQVVCKYG